MREISLAIWNRAMRYQKLLLFLDEIIENVSEEELQQYRKSVYYL